MAAPEITTANIKDIFISFGRHLNIVSPIRMYPCINLNLNHVLSLKAYSKDPFLPLPELYLISMLSLRCEELGHAY